MSSTDEQPTEAETTQHHHQAGDETATKKKRPGSSYYYWHGHEKERAKVGDVAPMPVPQLVGKSDGPVPGAAAPPVYPITKYSWADGEKAVTVYVDAKVDGQESMADNTLEVQFAKRRVTVSYVANVVSTKAITVQRKKQLVLHLSKAIKADESNYKIKESSGQIVLRLVKEEASSWWELVDKSTKPGDDDDEKEAELVDEDEE